MHGATRSTSISSVHTSSTGAWTWNVFSNSIVLLPRSAPRADLLQDLGQAHQVVSADQRAAVGERRRHPAGARGEAARGLARVDPDDPVGQPRQPLHLAADEGRVAGL